MALGTHRTRNWGKDAQSVALALLLARQRVAWTLRVTGTGPCRRQTLFLAPSHNGTTLPLVESAATLIHIRRGRWEARHPFDDRVLATGISVRDVVRATIEAVWQ